jgi:cytochrome c-L
VPAARGVSAFALVAAALWLPARLGADDAAKNPHAGSAEAIAEGKRFYLKAGCYACHGHEAEGAVGPDLTDDVWIYQPTDATLFKTISQGRAGTVMAGFADQLSAHEIWKIIAFIRSKYRGDPAKIIW